MCASRMESAGGIFVALDSQVTRRRNESGILQNHGLTDPWAAEHTASVHKSSVSRFSAGTRRLTLTTANIANYKKEVIEAAQQIVHSGIMTKSLHGNVSMKLPDQDVHML